MSLTALPSGPRTASVEGRDTPPTMRTFTLTSAITFALCCVSCGGLMRAAAPQSAPQPAQTPGGVQTHTLSPEGLDAETRLKMKRLLFGDLSLEEMLEGVEPDEEPWRSYASALAHSRAGKTEEAKKDLRRVLSMPEPETRVLLVAWSALRGLGERPPAATAGRVQGVVCELHNEAGVGTLAAYADGRARWLGGQGAATFWEAAGDKEMDGLVAGLLKSAEPLVKRSPAVERRPRSEPPRDHFRVSVLTFGGIHVTEVYGPEITDWSHFAGPTLKSSVELLNALSKRAEEGDAKPRAGTRPGPRD